MTAVTFVVIVMFSFGAANIRTVEMKCSTYACVRLAKEAAESSPAFREFLVWPKAEYAPVIGGEGEGGVKAYINPPMIHETLG